MTLLDFNFLQKIKNRMKKTMIYYLLFALFATYACGRGKGGGSEEVAPAEIPAKETVVVKDIVKKDSFPPEKPCEKDSTPIISERIDISPNIIEKLAPKEPNIFIPIAQKPFYFIINSVENEIYKGLLTSEGKPLTPINFEKYSLVVAGMIAANGDFLRDVRITQICTIGTLQSNVFMIAGGSTTFKSINFSFTIPKVKEDMQINFNIIYKNN
jgi:hypothetical protein